MSICQNCGNNDPKLSLSERCDDFNPTDDMGCENNCSAVMKGWKCIKASSFPITWKGPCTPICGDGLVVKTEMCDDKGAPNGCNSTCDGYDPYWTCDGSSPSKCSPICGDLYEVSDKECEDDYIDDEGCLENCSASLPGWDCVRNSSMEISVCKELCGNKIKTKYEECDNGNLKGCPDCKVDKGWNCTSSNGNLSNCTMICGDNYQLDSLKDCDDENMTDSLGCKQDCQGPLPGWNCS